MIGSGTTPSTRQPVLDSLLTWSGMLHHFSFLLHPFLISHMPISLCLSSFSQIILLLALPQDAPLPPDWNWFCQPQACCNLGMNQHPELSVRPCWAWESETPPDLPCFLADDHADSFGLEVVVVPLATTINEFGAELSFFIIPPAWEVGHAGANFLWHTADVCREIKEQSCLDAGLPGQCPPPPASGHCSLCPYWEAYLSQDSAPKSVRTLATHFNLSGSWLPVHPQKLI